jgi:hypothetical protein
MNDADHEALQWLTVDELVARRRELVREYDRQLRSLSRTGRGSLRLGVSGGDRRCSAACSFRAFMANDQVVPPDLAQRTMVVFRGS